MAPINPKITTRSVNFGMLLLSAVVMILTVRLTIASDLDSLEAAAEQGDAAAQVNLGVMYNAGEGVPQNDTVAVRWVRMSAEQGDADAQRLLGNIYSIGSGIPKDYVQAYAWYNIAATQGDGMAKENLEDITKEMTTADITKALSREYWEAYGPNRALSE